MNEIIVVASSIVTPADVSRFQFGMRFGRLDPVCQLGLTAVEALEIDFASRSRADIGVLVTTRAGSLSTDVQYWRTRNEAGGVSPSLFVYTLPSSLIGEIAIRHGLMGPNLCLLGGRSELLSEAADWLRHGEATACVCVDCDVVTPVAGELSGLPVENRACAAFLECGSDLPGATDQGETNCARKGTRTGATLTENDRDLISLCARLRRPVG